jgi:hypothetical protein
VGPEKEGWRLALQTYRAVLKWNGAFTNSAKKEINMNRELGAPLKNRAAQRWEIFFTYEVPRILERVENEGPALFKTFFKNFSERNGALGTPLHETEIFRGQLPNLLTTLEAAVTHLKKEIQLEQRKLNRKIIEPQIKETMRPVYEEWHTFKGKGGLDRMRTRVQDHVSINLEMYNDCVKNIGNRVRPMLQKVVRTRFNAIKDILDQICDACDNISAGPTWNGDSEKDAKLAEVHGLVRTLLKNAENELNNISTKPAEALELEPTDSEHDEDEEMVEVSEDDAEIKYESEDEMDLS